jgi:hypothetical protein
LKAAFALWVATLLIAPRARAVGFAAQDAAPRGDEPITTSAATKPPGISASVEGTLGKRRLFGIPIDMKELRAALGPSDSFSKPVMPYGFASVMLGKTKAGLSLGHVLFGGRVDFRLSYLHGGITLGAGRFWLARTSEIEMGNLAGLGELFLGPQVPLGSHAALSVDASLAAELLPGHDGTIVYGPGLSLRLRFY